MRTLENVPFTDEDMPLCKCGNKRPFVWKQRYIGESQIWYSCAECGHTWKLEDNDLTNLNKYWKRYFWREGQPNK